MDINKSLLNFVASGVIICKQLDDFYDAYHEDKEFADAVDLLSSIAIDMRQLKGELYASEDANILGAKEYMQKYYPSAILLIELIPKDKRKFIH
ncbi:MULTISPECIES: hypothetical protein [Enterococcus]|jgi:hypothetical protein|uniref:hypothetical protein n=1 Tax=Enterococcus TaxID=1350 RepID=UPI0003530EC9|nr:MULTISPECIES: hypothetical protein [Enterococcus]EPH92100.1 hypothetical protein D922_02514 [Enterococcus faecalis 06-MB-DW-09]WEI90892.1 hypothetical protein PZY29_09065 [Enterococcus casseliflavus]